MFFYELHEGDDEVYSDVLVVSESEWEPQEFFELVQRIRDDLKDQYDQDTLIEAIAAVLERDHGFVFVNDERLVAAVNVSTRTPTTSWPTSMPATATTTTTTTTTTRTTTSRAATTGRCWRNSTSTTRAERTRSCPTSGSHAGLRHEPDRRPQWHDVTTEVIDMVGKSHDRIVVESEKVGKAAREGDILEVIEGCVRAALSRDLG